MSDDLYEDLEDQVVLAPASSAASNRKRHRSSSAAPLSLTDEVQALQARVQALEAENKTLRQNMGTLYRTATGEIRRKDVEIVNLQRELEQALAANATSHR